MSLAEAQPTAWPGLTTGTKAAMVALIVGAVCLMLAPSAQWLVKFPVAWTLPASDWIGTVLRALLGFLKPAARGFSAAMEYPMTGANFLLGQTPWPLVIGAVTALGWDLGGLRMALLGAIGLSFVLTSGYWAESMNTLSLVAVSVPLALLSGLGIGIAANEVPRIKAALQTLLDIMQTVPTFAYLTPLLILFGFGPVVGLIASAIYAAPPMVRNTILGLERVDPEIKEAAVMSGGTRPQQLFLVEIPAASPQIMVGVNQCLMAALSMVIIAAVIGGFNDIGWEVLLTMRKAQFGQAFLAGLVIVVFAIIIDRMSATLATERKSYGGRIALAILGAAALLAVLAWAALPDPATYRYFDGIADTVDDALGSFTARNGASLDAIKNGAMFYGLLPLRIGLDDAVLPFTWVYSWTQGMSLILFALAALAGLGLALRGSPTLGIMVLIAAGVIETGVSHLPWPFVLTGAGALGWAAGGRRLATFAVLMLGAVLVSGLWDRALLSLYLSGAAVFACAVLGGALGLLSAVSPLA